MAVLRSYVSGRWFAPGDDGAPRPRRGHRRRGRPDLHRRHRHAGRARVRPHVGGPALRELTFHQRAALLKALGGDAARNTARSSTRCPRAPAPPCRLEVRRRRRHRRAARLCEQGQAGAAQRHASTSKAQPNRWARAGSSSASTSSPRCAAWPCRSTRSTSRSGGRWRSSRPRSSPACRRWSSRRRRPRTSPRGWSS